jgi:cytochrome b
MTVPRLMTAVERAVSSILHTYLSTALQFCVCAHILAAIVMSVWTRENLLGAMLTGFKRDHKDRDTSH